MLPLEILGLIDNEEHETLGPCGCSDYHMSDCPIWTDDTEDEEEDYG